MKNKIAGQQLDRFCQLRAPGYAVLIDAPWGAGKTHFIMSWMREQKGVLYISLYGAASVYEAETRILEAVISKNKNLKPPRVAEGVEKIANNRLGLHLGLSEVYRRSALKAAPRILVVDDLERSELTANGVLGFINEYVEHQGKNVILISDQEALKAKFTSSDSAKFSGYATVKEKVIGRILAIQSNPLAIVRDFEPQGMHSNTSWPMRCIERLSGTHKEKEYKKAIVREEELIADVFRALGIQNLRLLKQALREFEYVYRVMAPSMRQDGEKLRMVLSTYLALCMSFNGGRGFGLDDLSQPKSWDRAMWEFNGRKGEEPQKKPIDFIREECSQIDSINLDGLVITNGLAKHTIGKGYLDEDFIRSELNKAPYLNDTDSESWRVLWHWPNEDSERVNVELRKVLDGLKKHEIIEPIELLHLFGIFQDLADQGVPLDFSGSVLDFFTEYVDDLLSNGRLPTKFPISESAMSFEDLNNTGLGFSSKNKSEFKLFQAHLERCLDQSFWNCIKRNPNDLIEHAVRDVDALVRMLDDSGMRDELPNYSRIPVMGLSDPKTMADALLEIGAAKANRIVNVYDRRIERLDGIHADKRGCAWPDERKWLKSVGREMSVSLSVSDDDVLVAQFKRICTRIEQIVGMA